MIIKECFVTYNGISCINSQSNIFNINIMKNYINGYFLIRLLEIVITDTISKKNDFRLINFNSLYIDF